MADFKAALEHTLSVEGGYVNDPKDLGGETYKGIARKYHPNWGGWKVIDATKEKPCFPLCLSRDQDLQEQVAIFYKKKFWDVMKLDELVSQAIAEELFDTGVNIGWKRVAKWFQESLNLLNRDEKDFDDLTVDGAIGKKSLDAFKAYMNTSRFSSRNREKNEKVMLKVLNHAQIDRYKRITVARKTNEAFFYGWIANRA